MNPTTPGPPAEPALLHDILTIARKEWREWFLRGGKLTRGLLPMMIFPVGLMGVFLPIQSGPLWLGWPALLSNGVWLPQLLVLGVVADSFAGERERKTLETLLATRLSDTAILLGKYAAAVGYALGMSLLSAIVGLLVVNANLAAKAAKAAETLAANTENPEILAPPLNYPLAVWVGIPLFALLTAGFAAGIGVHVSLRAPTVRQAQQALSMATLALTLGVALLIAATPPSWFRFLAETLRGGTALALASATLAALVAADLALVLAARARFRRNRLILDDA